MRRLVRAPLVIAFSAAALCASYAPLPQAPTVEDAAVESHTAGFTDQSEEIAPWTVGTARWRW